MQNSPFKTSPLIIIAAVSMIIFIIVGIAAIIYQIQAANSTTSEPAARGFLESGIKTNIMPIVEKRTSTQIMELTKPCANCGVIDSITVNEAKGDRSAANSAYTGHEIEKNVNQTVVHLVKVHMDNGTYRVVLQQDQPIFHVGEKVKIINGTVVQLEKTKMISTNEKFTIMLGVLTNRFF
jgi:hypothetical protein